MQPERWLRGQTRAGGGVSRRPAGFAFTAWDGINAVNPGGLEAEPPVPEERFPLGVDFIPLPPFSFLPVPSDSW